VEDAGSARHRPEPQRPPRADDARSREFQEALEAVSREIRDPVRKLRYIRGSLGRYRGAQRRVALIPWALVRRAAYRRLSHHALEQMRKDPTAFRAGAESLAAPTAQRAPRRRRWLPLVAAIPIAAALGVLVWPRVSSEAAASRSAAQVPASVEVPVEPGPALPPTAPTAGVWLVESGPGWEQYSNGLRIDTRLAVPFDPRLYRVFDRKTGRLSEPRHDPAGILFHTSQSDIWPMEPGYNENLRDSSQRLLRYIQRNHLYNYVIDRFGRVFRVVEETSKANHAGFSVWATRDEVHLNLNHAFLGVCFETRWDGGQALPITQAQLSGGRALTAWLRHRWKVEPDMCTTHGIASVNPTKRLIGRHLDWARGFPFEAFGLPDVYATPAPSVAVFGFGYDDDFIAVMGAPWEGVNIAERELASEATRSGVTVDELRSEKHRLYDRWREEQATAEEQAARPRTAQAGIRGG